MAGDYPPGQRRRGAGREDVLPEPAQRLQHSVRGSQDRHGICGSHHQPTHSQAHSSISASENKTGRFFGKKNQIKAFDELTIKKCGKS